MDVPSGAEYCLTRARMVRADDAVLQARDAGAGGVGRHQTRRHAVRPERRVDQHGLPRLDGHVVEDEVAEAVRDQPALVGLEPLQHVRVVADHEVGAGVDGGVRLTGLLADGVVLVLVAPVDSRRRRSRPCAASALMSRFMRSTLLNAWATPAWLDVASKPGHHTSL